MFLGKVNLRPLEKGGGQGDVGNPGGEAGGQPSLQQGSSSQQPETVENNGNQTQISSGANLTDLMD